MIKLSFELNGVALAKWKPRALRLYLADDFAKAADLYYLLRRHVSAVHLVPSEGGVSQRLGRGALRPVGFYASEKLVPYPAQANPAFGILQDYFVLPQKFLFLDLVGWDAWRARGTGQRFDVHLEFETLPFLPTRITSNSFVLHATPAVNLFTHEADPVYVDHHKAEYHVRPSGQNAEHYQIFSFDEVTGFAQGSAEERIYQPFDVFRRATRTRPVYRERRKPSTAHAGIEHSLSIVYPAGSELPTPETLALQLQCTNGPLPASLKAGDISQHGKGCPEYVTFENILPPTPGIPPPVGKDFLWRLVSHLSIGFQSLEQLETLKALLELYIFPDSTEYAALANRKRIDGIKKAAVRGCDRLVNGVPVRGRNIVLDVREDHFSSRGDLFLFGCMLDVFFANYASINAFTQLTFRNLNGGTGITWPARIGTRSLI
jgi:type VI secretion system protein ImpG